MGGSIDVDKLWVSKPIFGADGADVLRSDDSTYGSRSYTEFVKATKESEITIEASKLEYTD